MQLLEFRHALRVGAEERILIGRGRLARRQHQRRRSDSGSRRCARPGARPGTCAQSHRPPRASRSRAPRSARRRDDRAGRTCADRCSRRARDESDPAADRSHASARRCFRSAARSARRWCGPRTPPTGSAPRRASRRWLTNCEVPVRRRSTSRCRSASASASPGGQPSTMQPSAGPWLSPKLVTENNRPSVLPDIWLVSASHFSVPLQ